MKEKVGPDGSKSKELIMRKTEYLKARVGRRPIKLARWGDDHHNEDKKEDQVQAKTHFSRNVIQSPK